MNASLNPNKITVLGSFNVDMMARTPKLPAPGETVTGSFFSQNPGGKGFNQGVAAHQAGANVQMIAKVGTDALAPIAYRVMENFGMNSGYFCTSKDTSTGIALISVNEQNGQNSIIVVSGANYTFDSDDLERITPLIQDSSYLLIQFEINQWMNEQAVLKAKEAGVRVVVNTAPYQPQNPKFYDGIYLVTPNELEARDMTGISIDDLESADRAAQVLRKMGIENVIITLGSRGVYVNDGTSSGILPAFKVTAVDTTGAGDAFNGGLVTALSEGKTLFEAAHFANAVAALSVTRMGAASSMPKREEIDDFLAQQGEFFT